MGQMHLLPKQRCVLSLMKTQAFNQGFYGDLLQVNQQNPSTFKARVGLLQFPHPLEVVQRIQCFLSMSMLDVQSVCHLTQSQTAR